MPLPIDFIGSEALLKPVLLNSNRLFSVTVPDMGNLPAIPPYDQSDLYFGAEPSDEDYGRDFEQVGYATATFQFGTRATGNTINATWPNANLIATQIFTRPIAVVALSVSYAIVNPAPSANEMGLLAVINNGNVPTINVGQSGDALLSIYVPPPGLMDVWSGRETITFSLDVAPVISAGQAMCLYAISPNDANNIIAATINMKYVYL